VLEIGFGTGLNLPFYPERVQRLVALDVNPAMPALAKKRIAASAIAVDYRVLDGESLPFSDASFDCVVSTWTLCSIRRVEQALAEVRRVLRPGGRFFFVEHGLSPDPDVAVWQHRLTPMQRVIADGCHLDRDIAALVKNAGFALVQLEQQYAEGLSSVLGYFSLGIAAKPES